MKQGQSSTPADILVDIFNRGYAHVTRYDELT